jgi:hypothetical protein
MPYERSAAAVADACITPIGATTVAWLLCTNSGSLAEAAAWASDEAAARRRLWTPGSVAMADRQQGC